MPTLSQLEYAIAVDSYRHFARAAKSCHITQPTLSMQLAKLEDELGVILFDRSAQPIVPTSAGVTILDQARLVVAEFKKIQAIASGAMNEVIGDLTIGIIPTIAPYLIPLFLESLATKHKKLKLIIKEMTTANILENLARESIDVGILAVPIEGIDLHTESLYIEPFYFFVHEKHEIAKRKKIQIKDINGQELWLLEEGHCLRGQVLQACQIKDRKPALANVQFETGSIETLKELVRQGLGYTLIPHLAIADSDIDDPVKVIPFESPSPAREVGLMFRRAQLKKPSINALSESIKQNLPKSLGQAAKSASVLPVQ